ncbi:GNAT family N-acetyltransferase [Candidatus Bipolaricaulota bacterium]|nr:GNAT family N-acetyltransferase [Candidatus Bipolaricaulota bacterium]
MLQDVYLETEHMILRRLTMADAENLFDLDSDPEVMRYVTGGPPHSREFIAEKVLPQYLSYYDRFDKFGFWAAIGKATGDFMGWFHFRPFKENPEETELGYRLKKAYWTRGFATEASIALIEKGFCELGVTKVVATTMALNTRSRRVMEKVGLQFEKKYVYPGDPFPGWRAEDCLEVKYGLTKEQWESTASQ